MGIENLRDKYNQQHISFEGAALYEGVHASEYREAEIASQISKLVFETEIKPVQVEKVTNTSNSVVEEKARVLLSNFDLKGGKYAIPENQTREYPIQFDDETLEKAPWVNMIHAWTKVLNELNTVAAMQRGDTPILPKVIAAMAHTLYSFTTNADGDRFNRTDEDFLAGKKYVETIRRESGTKFVNPSRHICFEEMKYILDIVKESYPKK